jgi:SAM-dependent methyltransferase
MAVFPYKEIKYYSFGLRAGLANLAKNGLALGLKKTLGKITQPINALTRFPEYYYFDLAIESYLKDVSGAREIKILDVGSPKTLGLYLASKTRSALTLTDISELNVDEYRIMWRGVESGAKGSAEFALQDGRSLTYADGEFDVVYSMSVIEHIDGEAGDGKAVQEMIRVLKPGGLLLLSVPYGGRYVEQHRVGFAGAVKETKDSQTYFFQRIYDQLAFEKRILSSAGGLEQITLTTIWRKNLWIPTILGKVGTAARGLLGFMNPLFSVMVNRSRTGADTSFKVKYADIHTAGDIYGDMIMTGRKTGSGKTSAPSAKPQ